MMSKTPAIAPMMAWRTEAMPLTIAIRQAPMVRNTASICKFVLGNWESACFHKSEYVLTHETTAPILKYLLCGVK